MSNINIRKTGAIIFTIGAVVLLILSILGNDRLISVTILFAIVSVILSTSDKSANVKKSTKTNPLLNKALIWISIILIIVGIIFAIIV